jgi:hypothetical protein
VRGYEPPGLRLTPERSLVPHFGLASDQWKMIVTRSD